MTRIECRMIKYLRITLQTTQRRTYIHQRCLKWAQTTSALISIIMELLRKRFRQRAKCIARVIDSYWKPVSLTWHKYLGLTTIPGLQSVHNAQGKIFTVAWSLLFAIGLSCTIRDVYIGCLDYLAYPVTTAVNLHQAASLPFPAVTVCNLNRVHCGNLRELVRQNSGTDLGEQLKRLYEVTSCADMYRISRNGYQHIHDGSNRVSNPDMFSMRHRREAPGNGSDPSSEALTRTTTEPLPSLSTSTSNENDEEDGEVPINQTQSFNDLMNFMALYANFSEDNRTAMGHDAQGFIKACTFSGKSCSNVTLFFKTIQSTSYGNCFTFGTSRKTVIPGRDYGLSMELYLDQSNYIGGGLSPRAGARVVVHPPSQLPLPNENGLTIPPHTATSAALVQVQVTREKLPYATNCTSGWERTWYMARVGGAYEYSMERCQRVCLQLAFEDSCSCTHPSYMDVSTWVPPCNLTSENQDYTCVGRVLEEFETRTRECSCNMDCREIMYDMKISQAAWPTDHNWCEVAQRFGMLVACKYQSFRNKQLVLKNVLTIDVFFESLRVQSINQHPTYKLQSFVGSLGGALSLYLGVTLFMLLEVLEVIVRLIFALFQRVCFNPQRRLKMTQSRNVRRRRTIEQKGIFYTDFRFNGAVQFHKDINKADEIDKPIQFVW